MEYLKILVFIGIFALVKPQPEREANLSLLKRFRNYTNNLHMFEDISVNSSQYVGNLNCWLFNNSHHLDSALEGLSCDYNSTANASYERCKNESGCLINLGCVSQPPQYFFAAQLCLNRNNGNSSIQALSTRNCTDNQFVTPFPTRGLPSTKTTTVASSADPSTTSSQSTVAATTRPTETSSATMTSSDLTTATSIITSSTAFTLATTVDSSPSSSTTPSETSIATKPAGETSSETMSSSEAVTTSSSSSTPTTSPSGTTVASSADPSTTSSQSIVAATTRSTETSSGMMTSSDLTTATSIITSSIAFTSAITDTVETTATPGITTPPIDETTPETRMPSMPTTTLSMTASSATPNVVEELGNLIDAIKNGNANVSVDDVKAISNGAFGILDKTLAEKQIFTQMFSQYIRLATFPFNYSNDLFSVRVDIVDNERINAEEDVENPDNYINVVVPTSVLQIALDPQTQSNRSRGTTGSVAVALIRYKDNSFFPSNESFSQILSLDIGDGLGAAEFSNFGDPIQLRYLNVTGSNLSCVFWNYSTSAWSPDGCELDNSSPPTCNCNHTTNFALLINPYATPDPLLDALSLIGLILSICGLSITLTVHLIYRDLRKRRPSRVLMHICFNLLVGYIIFATGIYAIKIPKLCTAITFFLHFFFLAAWGWMTVYSYDMYISLVKVFDSHQSFFLRKFGGMAYGMALLISAVTLAVGLGIDSENDDIYRAANVCWVHQEALYYGFVVPIGIMFLFNIVVFIMVFREIIGQSKVTSSAAKQTAKQRLIIAITMICFTGLAWVFAFLLLALSEIDGDDTDAAYTRVFGWLFAIFNSLQGFGIFLLTTVKRKETRRLWWNPIKNRFTDAMSSISSPSSYRVTKYDAGTGISSIGEASQTCEATEIQNCSTVEDKSAEVHL